MSPPQYSLIVGDAEKLERFEKATSGVMLTLALAIVPLLIIPLVFDLSDRTADAIIAVDWMIWGLFAVEYLIRLYLAPRKLRFMTANKIDLLVIALPFLRPLRVIRSARALRLLRSLRAVAFIGRGMKALRIILTKHKLNHALAFTLAIAVGAALLVESFERNNPEANIKSIPDALWWAATTITTVGYGDHFPVTAGGRGIGVGLMVIGVALFGFLAGSIASYFLDPSKEPEPDQMTEVLQRLDRIEQMLLEERVPDSETLTTKGRGIPP